MSISPQDDFRHTRIHSLMKTEGKIYINKKGGGIEGGAEPTTA